MVKRENENFNFFSTRIKVVKGSRNTFLLLSTGHYGTGFLGVLKVSKSHFTKKS